MTPSRLPYNLDHDSRTHLVTLNMLIMVPVNASSSLQNVSVSSSSLEGSRVSTSAAPTEITRGGALNALLIATDGSKLTFAKYELLLSILKAASILFELLHLLEELLLRSCCIHFAHFLDDADKPDYKEIISYCIFL